MEYRITLTLSTVDDDTEADALVELDTVLEVRTVSGAIVTGQVIGLRVAQVEHD